MAFTAVQMELSRLVSSPVPWALLPSSRTNLVRVTTLVSKAPLSDILPSGVGPGPKASSEAGEHGPKVKQWTLEQGRGCATPLTNQKCPLWQRGVGLSTSVKVQSSEIASICFVSKRQWLVPDSIAAHSDLRSCVYVAQQRWILFVSVHGEEVHRYSKSFTQKQYLYSTAITKQVHFVWFWEFYFCLFKGRWLTDVTMEPLLLFTYINTIIFCYYLYNNVFFFYV